MADLPPERLSYLQPSFSFTGVDYFGPVTVKRGCRTRSLSGHNKRYVCLFTCLTFRAIHLELCEDMSTDSFIMAMHRFISRRGYPLKIMTDNGTNIIGANNELKKCLKELNHKTIKNELLTNSTGWQFIPPGSPWMGGAWESLVKIAKRCLKTVTNGHPVYDQQLYTILVKIEGTINSRPITPVSDDINDFQPLTANHFLIGRPSLYHRQGIFTEKELTSKRKWKVTQTLLKIFWKRFLKEYVPSLTVKKKWNKLHRNFKSKDLVLTQTENTLRVFWPLARINETYVSNDANVRSVKLKLPNSMVIRPSNKLYLLEECD